MPFPTNQPDRPFTKEGIEGIEEGQQGCYGIFRDDTCVYVGRGDIRGRLMDHLNGDIPEILEENPTHFVGSLAEGKDQKDLEIALILEYEPTCNKRLG